MDNVSIIIPTHNHYDVIGQLVDRIHKSLTRYRISYEIIFVDSQSTDYTRPYAFQLQNYYPVKLIKSTSKHTLGERIKQGISKAQYETVCVLNPDKQYAPEVLPEMLQELAHGASIVVADKTKTRRKKQSFYQKLIAKFVHNFEFDVRSGIKLFRKELVSVLSISNSNHAFDLEFIAKAQRAGYLIKTHEVSFPESKFGNKIGFFEAGFELIKSRFYPVFRKPQAALIGAKGGSVDTQDKNALSEKLAYNHKVTRYSQAVYTVIALLCVSFFGIWWFLPSHVPQNFTGTLHYLDILLFALVSYIIWHPIIMDVLTWSIASNIKDIKKQTPPDGLSVAFLTTIVPSSESLDLLHKTLPAMVKVHYKHDTWLLDEGHSAEVKAICDKYGVFYFSRKGVSVYNTKQGKFTKTKGGNHNSWYDMYGNAYDIVAQIDTDFVPKRTFLTKTLGYFKDPEVAFVGTPQVYGNTNDSLVAKGAAEQLYTFYGSVLRGLSSMRMTLLIGANHIIRASALKGVDHYSAHITEDLITGMKLHTKGWKSVYLSEALAIGEGPNTWEAYFSQQMRWAYGCMDIFFHHSPKMFKKMGFRRAIYYFFLQQHYFSGIAMALSIVLLSLYFIAGLRAADVDLFKFFTFYSSISVLCWLMSIWLQRFNVDRKRFGEFHLAGKIISVAAWPVWFLAFLCIMTGKKISYKVTPKGDGKFKVRESLSTFYPHMVFGVIALLGIATSFITNNQSIGMIFWASTSALLMLSIPFSQEISDIITSITRSGLQFIRKAYFFYKRITTFIQPRKAFIHNTARQNSSYFSKRHIVDAKAVARTYRKDNVLDITFLSIVVVLSVMLYVHQLGFYSDDWSFIGNFTVSPDQSLWGLIQTSFTPNTMMRPMQNIYDAILFWFFGTEPLGYQLVNSGVILGTTILMYLILRQLQLPRILAITLPIVYLLLPNYTADKFWYAAYQAYLSMFFFFLSLFAAIRAISPKTVWSSQWKIFSIISLIISALSYEVVLPFTLITFFVLLNPSEVFSNLIIRKSKPAQKDIIFVLVILIALFYVFLYKFKTTTRLHEGIDFNYMINMITSAFQVNYGTWIFNIPHIMGNVISLYATTEMFVVAGILCLTVFWYLFYVVTRKNAVFPSARWMWNLTLISFVVFFLGYFIFFTNNQVGFSPTGIDNRVAIAATIGVAMTLIGFAGFISRILMPEKYAKVFFSMLVALICSGGFLVINGVSTFWIKAHQEGQTVLADIYAHYPTMPKNSILFLDGVCPYVGPAPVFEAEWDLKGALQTHYKDATLRADIVTPRVKINKDSIQTQIYTFPAQYPYENLFVYNYNTKRTHPIRNADEANQYFQKYNPDFNNNCAIGAAGKGVPIF